MRIRHSSHNFATQPSHSLDRAGKPKWLPLNFGYHGVMRTGPIASDPRRHCASTEGTTGLSSITDGQMEKKKKATES